MISDNEIDFLDMDEGLWPLAIHLMRLERMAIILRHKKHISGQKSAAQYQPGNYGYVRAASRKTPFWKWCEERFFPRFPDLEVYVPSREGPWLESTDLLASATTDEALLYRRSYIAKFYLDKKSPRSVCLERILKDSLGDKKVTISVEEGNGIFGFFAYHYITISIRSLRMFRWTIDEIHAALEEVAKKEKCEFSAQLTSGKNPTIETLSATVVTAGDAAIIVKLIKQI